MQQEDDVSNAFHTANAPLSNEAFNQQLAQAETIETAPVTVVGDKLPEGYTEEQAIEDDRLQALENARLAASPNLAVPTDLRGGKLGDPSGNGYIADMAQGAFIGAKSGATEIVKTLANVTDFLAPDAWTKDPQYFTKMAEEFRPSLKAGDTEWQGFKTPTTQVGKTTQVVAQFMSGFVPAIKAMQGVKLLKTAAPGIVAAVKSLAGAGTAGVITDFSVFNPLDKRLSNMAVESGIPGFDNMMTRWLSQDNADSPILGRVKQAAEGVVAGKVISGGAKLVKGVARVTLEQIRSAAEGYMVPKVLEPMMATLDAYKKVKQAHVDEAHLDNTIDTLDTVDSAGIPSSTPRFTLKEPSVVVPDEATQADFAKSYLDGDYEGAAQKASGLVNLKYLDTEEGIRDMIEGFAQVKEAAIGKHVRGWTEASKAAGKLGVDAVPEATARVQGLDSFVIKAEETRTAVAYKVKELARIAKSSPSVVTMAEFKDAFAKLSVIDAMVTGNKSEIARAMKAMQRPSTGGEIAKNILAASKNAVGMQSQSEWDLMAEMIGNMPDSVGMVQLAKASRAPNWRDAMNEVWINNFFSVKTAVVNLASTGLSTVNTVADRYAGAYNSFIKGTEQGVSLTEANSYAYGLLAGINEGVAAFSKSWKTNAPVLGHNSQVLEANTFGSFNGAAFGITDGDSPLMMKLGKALDLTGIALRSLPGGTRSLLASDEFFKGMLYRGEIHALSVREAQKAGLKRGTPEYVAKLSEVMEGAKTSKPGDPYYGISSSALKFAEVNTFTEALGEGGTKILEGIRYIPGSYAVLPFAKTPTNLVKWMPRRTPGLAGFSSHMQAELNAGGARADLAEAQIGMGSLWLTAGMGLSAAGYLRGEITNNLKAKDNLSAMGVEQQAAIDPKTGEQTALIRLDGSPVSFLLFSATVRETVDAYIETNQEEMTPEELDNGIMSIMAIPISVGAKLSLSKSWAQGISQLIDAVKNDTEGKYLQKVAGNLLPAANTVKWVNTTFFDPYMREADDALEEIISKIPGLSRSLPPRPDPLGNPREHKKLDGFGTNPITQSIPDDSPVMTELRRLQLKTPNEIILGTVKRDLDMVKFDPVEKWNYMQFVRHIKDDDGKDLVDSLEAVMASDDYNSPTVTDAARNDFLKDMYNKRKDLADKAIQYDSLAFSQGHERPYAKEYGLYDYKRVTPLASKLSTKQFTKAQKLFGNVGKTRQEYIDDHNDEIVKSNLGLELK